MFDLEELNFSLVLRRLTGKMTTGGVTDREIRKQRAREAIRRRHLQTKVAEGLARPNEKPLTWSAAFERIYREPL